jgi:hypothetical protein
MVSRAKTIHVEDDPKYGPVIKCFDINEADTLEDFLTAKNVAEFSVRFSEDQVELFVPSVSIERVIELVSEFRDRHIDPSTEAGE